MPSHLGPYEIVALLGSGGMGEVYRARDPRIGREVAIKILPRTAEHDPERLRRFAQEARAAGALNHPNLLVIHDVGESEGVPYLVTELLEGTTLRMKIARGAVPLEKAITYAVAIARGCAAAHERGIVHRDLKPENIFITSDDRPKLLDFGLAKLLRNDVSPGEDSSTAVRNTAPGDVLGTPAYMAPEQVRGEVVDHRADIFSLGVVLAEMATGTHPFGRGPSLRVMSAILADEPKLDESLGGGLRRIVEHMIEKSPARRFESMNDVAFALEMLSGGSDAATERKTAKPKAPRRKEKRPEDIRYRRVTYRRGFVSNARFAPDGSVVYGAAWEGNPLEVFSSLPGTPEARGLGLADADLLAVSPTGELAVSLRRVFTSGYMTTGTLARIPLAGGVPREVCEEMQDADWMPDGKSLAIIRRSGFDFVIECPIGHQVYASGKWISDLRISPAGHLLAVIEHPVWGDDAGRAVILDMSGRRVAESQQEFGSVGGLAWTPGGDEVWIAALGPGGPGHNLVALGVKGKERTVLHTPTRLTIHDIAPQGVLVSYHDGRREILAGTKGDSEERNLSWFDWSYPCGLTGDGARLLLEEQASARRSEENSIYMRATDGAPAVHLGEGRARGGFSPDGKWIATLTAAEEGSFHLLPTGAGQPRRLSHAPIRELYSWVWSRDGASLFISGSGASAMMRLWQLPLDGSGARSVGPEGIGWPIAEAPDGRVAASVPDGPPVVFGIDDGEAVPLPSSQPGDMPRHWTKDGSSVLVYRSLRDTVRIDAIHLVSGERTLWKELHPHDSAGILSINPILIAANDESYAYGFRRMLSETYIVDGLL